MNKDSKIYVAGHTGLVGNAILWKLIANDYTNIATCASNHLNLVNQREVDDFFDRIRPEYVFMAAAKVGGVLANNTYRGDFLYNNLMIQSNIMESARRYGVKKLLFLGSNCLYPSLAAQPIREEYLLAGKLEPTTEYYAIAKISGIKMCEAFRDQYGCNFISALPVNLYGGDADVGLQSAHVMPALIKKFRLAIDACASAVEVWGTGTPRREFMHVDDLADACLFLMQNYNERGPINVGTGTDISIKDLAYMIKDVFGYGGEIVFDPTKPNGSNGKLLDVSKIHALGWHHKIELRQGIELMYRTIKSK